MLDASGGAPVVDIAVDLQRAEHRRGQGRDGDDRRQPPADPPVAQREPRPGRRLAATGRAAGARRPRAARAGGALGPAALWPLIPWRGRAWPVADRGIGGSRVPSAVAWRQSPAVLPPARSPEPPPSACPPLTDPVSLAVSPGFVTDRLRTTFAPRIGKPDLHACPAATHEAAHHTHPSFPPQRSPLLGSTGRPRPHSRVTKRVRTYNHLLGGRHGAFASKPARSSPS